MTPDLERARDAIRAECLSIFGANWSNDVADRFVRAVLLAIREPSEAMRLAGREHDADQIERPDVEGRNAVSVWQGIISAILGEAK